MKAAAGFLALGEAAFFGLFFGAALGLAGDFLATVFFFAGLFAFEAGFLAGLFFLAGDLVGAGEPCPDCGVVFVSVPSARR